MLTGLDELGMVFLKAFLNYIILSLIPLKLDYTTGTLHGINDKKKYVYKQSPYCSIRIQTILLWSLFITGFN